jgi:hypothetical protein
VLCHALCKLMPWLLVMRALIFATPQDFRPNFKFTGGQNNSEESKTYQPSESFTNVTKVVPPDLEMVHDLKQTSLPKIKTGYHEAFVFD